MERTGKDDRRLIGAARKADASAFEEIYYRYRDWLTGLAFRFTGNEEDALDVLQETFTYLVRKFPGFQLSASMKTLLYPVVTNLSIGARRRRKRELSLKHVGADGATSGRGAGYARTGPQKGIARSMSV